ncbi:MAG: hypothetical protein ABIP30_15350 [Ferruginibacter sp.]
MKPSITILFICVLLSVSCTKQSTVPGTTPPTTPLPPGTPCTAQKADAETITIFPKDNPWNTDISAAPVDAYSKQILAAYSTTGIKSDFGSGLYDNGLIGIPFVVVCGSQTKIPVTFRANGNDGNYGDESDAGPYAIPLNAPIEGNGVGDSHVISVDKENGILYELYNASVNGNHWEASSAAIFNLNSNQVRTEGWTSADAAGLPIFPGLVRYDEILKGEIDHAIRFTLTKANVKAAYIFPARHKVNSTGSIYSLPFGARIRLSNAFDISGYPARMQIILKAMKKYGLVLADIGTNMYISGAPDERWDNDELRLLLNVKAVNFEVVKLN